MKTRVGRASRSFARDESGAALVEFALISIVLLILLFGIIDFGRMLYTKNSLTNAAREGGRYAAVMENPPASVDSIKSIVIAHMSPLGGDTLTASEIDVAFNYGGAGSVLQSTTVTINYPFNPLTPIWSFIGGDSLRTLRASAQFRWELGG